MKVGRFERTTERTMIAHVTMAQLDNAPKVVGTYMEYRIPDPTTQEKEFIRAHGEDCKKIVLVAGYLKGKIRRYAIDEKYGVSICCASICCYLIKELP